MIEALNQHGHFMYGLRFGLGMTLGVAASLCLIAFVWFVLVVAVNQLTD